MDAVTHALASYALARAAFPRISRTALVGVIIAGVMADVDAISARFGPSAFLRWYRTSTHSLVAAAVISLAAFGVVAFLSRHKPNKDPLATLFVAALSAALLHLVMDLSQNDRTQILWPFRTERYSADVVAHFDLWILLALLAGALLPLLFRLITEEIGAKSKAPRGRIGATLALAALVLYVGARCILHADAIAILEARTYHGESPRRVAALAEPDSPFRWRGIIDTERALHDIEVNVAPGASFNPDAAATFYKPESSPPLEAARNTEAARQFLQSVRFPKASVEKTLTGYRVELGNFPHSRDAQSERQVMAVIETNGEGEPLHEELTWEKASRKPTQ